MIWTLVGFLDRFDRWAEQEQPPGEVKRAVYTWMLTRMDDPYRDARRQPDFPNLWFCPIAGSEHGDSLIVVCSYWIREGEHVVACDSVASLSWPV